MRALFWILALFALAVGLTVLARYNGGYVLVVVAPYRVELSLALALLLLVGGFILAYGLVRITLRTLRLPGAVRAFHARRRHDKAHAAFHEALEAFFAGRFGKAEKAAATALALGESPGLSAVIAARAAHGLKAFGKRDRYLNEAEAFAPDDAHLRLMAQAELLVDERRFHDALETLKALPEKHTAALKLELRARQELRHWDKVLPLVQQLEKRRVLDEGDATRLRRRAYAEMLRNWGDDGPALKDFWDKIPAPEKRDPRVAAAAAERFFRFGEPTLAQGILEAGLEQSWDTRLVLLYGDCAAGDAVRQIERAESWLKVHDRDAALLLTLGKLCTSQGLWGKAQSYLEASLAVQPSFEAYLALARLEERHGDDGRACANYRRSLELALEELAGR